MGKLINQERRSQLRAAKQERKQQISAAALETFQRFPYPEVSLEGISRRAKVKHGLASLYYGSKEELFLQLLSGQINPWFDDLERRIGELPPTPGRAASKLPRLLARSLAERPALTRLLSLEHVVVEEKAAVETALVFLQTKELRLKRVGAVMEQRCSLPSGRGAWLLHRTLLAVVGLRAAEGPYPAADSIFKVDFEEELQLLVRDLLNRS